MKKKDRLGFCCEIGAPRSVIGQKELRRVMYRLQRHKLPTDQSNHRLRFADTNYQSLRQIELPLATPPGISVVYVTLDIVSADIPALLGLDVLDDESPMVDTVTKPLWKRVITSDEDEPLTYIDLWHVKLTRYDNHVYAAMSFPRNIFFTRTHLSKLHLQFKHPSATSLFNLLRRAHPDNLSSDTLSIVEDIGQRCVPCQKIQKAANRFILSFGAENVRFNERVLTDNMYIYRKPILHIVDEGTKFSAARFLPNSSTGTVWQTFLTCWAAKCTGLRHKIVVGQGSQFGKIFKRVGALRHVEIVETGTESHSSLGLGERYHEPFRTTHRKLSLQFLRVDPEVLLSFSVKAMNDTLGLGGLVSSAFVFGEYSSIQTVSEPLEEKLTVSSRAELAMAALKEMGDITAKQRVQRGLHRNDLAAADRTFAPGDKVLVWRVPTESESVLKYSMPTRNVCTLRRSELFRQNLLTSLKSSPSYLLKISLNCFCGYHGSLPRLHITGGRRNILKEYSRQVFLALLHLKWLRLG